MSEQLSRSISSLLSTHRKSTIELIFPSSCWDVWRGIDGEGWAEMTEQSTRVSDKARALPLLSCARMG